MSSLSVHLRLPEDHSGLPFHPSCPVCRRDRLAGSLDGDEIVSRRTQAAIAVGLLAFSGVGAPAVAVAAGPDQDIDGSAEVVQSPDPGADVDETSTAWTDGGAAPTDDESPELAPETEDGSMEPTLREPAAEPVAEAPDEIEDPDPVTEPATDPGALAAPPAEDPTATTEAAAPEGILVDTADRAERERPVKRVKATVQPRPVAAPAPVEAPAPPQTAPVSVVAGANQSTADRASSGDRFHVVQRGESLWSIATDLTGERADVAQIAREVDRLWELNEDRIASGNPDLLYTGARLRLR
jgi:nucleoid-associated protein YgaU